VSVQGTVASTVTVSVRVGTWVAAGWAGCRSRAAKFCSAHDQPPEDVRKAGLVGHVADVALELQVVQAALGTVTWAWATASVGWYLR